MGKRTRRVQASETLPEAELEVLACLWNAGAQTAAEVRELLAEYRPMTHGSVLTLLKRLSTKEQVKREKAAQGKAFVYSAARGPKPTYGRLLNRITQRIFGGSSVALVASLLESQPTSPEELKQLKRLVDQLEKQSRSKGTS